MNEISDAKNVKAKITCIAGQTTLDDQREIKKDEEIIFLLQVHMYYYLQTVRTLKSKKNTFYILCSLVLTLYYFFVLVPLDHHL